MCVKQTNCGVDLHTAQVDIFIIALFLSGSIYIKLCHVLFILYEVSWFTRMLVFVVIGGGVTRVDFFVAISTSLKKIEKIKKEFLLSRPGLSRDTKNRSDRYQ